MIARKFFVLPFLVIGNEESEESSPIRAGDNAEGVAEKARRVFENNSGESKHCGADSRQR